MEEQICFVQISRFRDCRNELCFICLVFLLFNTLDINNFESEVELEFRF